MRGQPQRKYERQRRLRSARRYDTTDGLAAITVEGDDATIDAMWNRLVADADGFYQSDGGRDVPAGSHRRTNHQRLFDACVDALGGGADDRSRTGSQRPTFVVTATLDKLGGRKLSEAAEQVGTGPIADALLAIYLEDADVIGMVFGGDGQPLWLGRKRRHASAAHFLALTIRDRGCVLCGAAASRCEAHHLTPWNAPRRRANRHRSARTRVLDMSPRDPRLRPNPATGPRQPGLANALSPTRRTTDRPEPAIRTEAGLWAGALVNSPRISGDNFPEDCCNAASTDVCSRGFLCCSDSRRRDADVRTGRHGDDPSGRGVAPR